MRSAALTLLLAAGLPLPLGAQRQHPPAAHDTAALRPHEAHEMMMPGPLGIPLTREASGTAWLPGVSPMYAIHADAGRWELMTHGNVFLQYIDEGSRRGGEQLGSINWFMGMARRRLAGGLLRLQTMLSLEPITVGECGYPDLLATGEFCDGEPLHDRQHPHDLFMDLSLAYERTIGRDLAFQLYGGPVGEPALGPVAYPHRISALPNPFAPITHHWIDATHISFGVITAALFGRRWKLDGSIFNGREPDEERFDFDLAPLDSYSGRLWLLPDERWALQASIARLNEAELHRPGEPRRGLTRATASATLHQPIGSRGIWASTLAWGRNREQGEDAATDAALLETNLNLEERNVFFGRVEIVEKTGEDLVLERPLLEEVFTLGKLSLGYLRQFPLGAWLPGLGASLSVSFLADGLEPFYGNTAPFGFAVFGNLKPAPMAPPAVAAANGAAQPHVDH